MSSSAKTIEDLTLLENYLVALNFPDKGIVPFRIETREQLIYNPYTVKYSSTVTRFAADTWKDSNKLGHPTDTSIDNLFEVDSKLRLYQLFFGIKGGDIRAYPTYPSGIPRRSLDIKSISSKADFGYIDGNMSPYNDPKPVSETWVPKDLDIGFAWYNRGSVAQTIVTKWIVNMYGVKIIKDIDLVEKILKRKGEGANCRIVTLGGLDPFIYNTNGVWGVSPIKLEATREEIKAALGINDVCEGITSG